MTSFANKQRAFGQPNKKRGNLEYYLEPGFFYFVLKPCQIKLHNSSFTEKKLKLFFTNGKSKFWQPLFRVDFHIRVRFRFGLSHWKRTIVFIFIIFKTTVTHSNIGLIYIYRPYSNNSNLWVYFMSLKYLRLPFKRAKVRLKFLFFTCCDWGWDSYWKPCFLLDSMVYWRLVLKLNPNCNSGFSTNFF